MRERVSRRRKRRNSEEGDVETPVSVFGRPRLEGTTTTSTLVKSGRTRRGSDFMIRGLKVSDWWGHLAS